jgi:hypothetical protein
MASMQVLVRLKAPLQLGLGQQVQAEEQQQQ